MLQKDEILLLVKNSGGAGLTSVEIERMTGAEIKRIAACLHQLVNDRAVRREKVAGDMRALFRYWYLGERRAPVKAQTTRRKSAPDVLLTLPAGKNQSISLTLDEARTLYTQLGVLFNR